MIEVCRKNWIVTVNNFKNDFMSTVFSYIDLENRVGFNISNYKTASNI